MARKTPQEQIYAARDMLRKAQARQRQADVRSKIVLGALAIGWLRSNPRAAEAFNGYLNHISIREQDAEVVAEFLSSIATNTVSANQSHPATEGSESSMRRT